jgi:hypothetical protein
MFGQKDGWFPIMGLTQQRDEKLHRILSNILKYLSNSRISTSHFLAVFLVEKRELGIDEFFNQSNCLYKSLRYFQAVCWVRPNMSRLSKHG